MNTGNWTKLYGNTIYSTLWQEPPPIRCVWITLLALSDFEGYVGASIPGLAKAANVDLEVTEAALERFKSPDKYSRSKEHDGRRIEDAPGGWRILNFISHRDGSEVQREKWRLAKKRQRQNKFPVKGVPMGGETAAIKAEERGDYAGAAAIAAAGLPGTPVKVNGEPPLDMPEIPLNEPQDPPVESGRMVDGEWVPD